MDRPLTETAYQRANRDLWAVRYAKTFSDEVKKHTRATFGHSAYNFFFGMWPEGIMPPVFEEIKDEPQHSQAICKSSEPSPALTAWLSKESLDTKARVAF